MSSRSPSPSRSPRASTRRASGTPSVEEIFRAQQASGRAVAPQSIVREMVPPPRDAVPGTYLAKGVTGAAAAALSPRGRKKGGRDCGDEPVPATYDRYSPRNVAGGDHGGRWNAGGARRWDERTRTWIVDGAGMGSDHGWERKKRWDERSRTWVVDGAGGDHGQYYSPRMQTQGYQMSAYPAQQQYGRGGMPVSVPAYSVPSVAMPGASTGPVPYTLGGAVNTLMNSVSGRQVSIPTSWR